jgi:hypothetical protein
MEENVYECNNAQSRKELLATQKKKALDIIVEQFFQRLESEGFQMFFVFSR